jgi:flagellar protein FlgJ
MELSNVKPTLDSLQPNQSSSVQSYHNYTDVNALSDLKKKARDDQESALRPVAEQFEAIFVQQILKESRKVSFDEGWLDGGQGDFYKDWSDKQLSLNLSSKGTLGFADNIVEQLGKSIRPAKQTEHASETVADVSPQQTAAEQVGSTEHALALRNIINNNLK